ncbi:hypothetical protein G159_02110 [Planococcus glaciei CHR43]|uniref:hypothetical protein n=1 Tax=Planococcus glaciei TaxID=459472 RepID=UPI0003DEF603|nr:hypothetical protein [Planococcus glaciei]ETP70345.1 hypothetical protein G159_02110 [Planococcus glaciei CHR43]
MAKIPVKLVVDTAKLHGPKVIKFAKDNEKIILAAIPSVAAGAKKLKEIRDNKKEVDSKEHLRKKRFAEYKQTEFNTQNKVHLLKSKHEIENFILQIMTEEERELAFKKPVHSKRIKNWNSILIQLEDQMAVLDYEEYLKIYNNPKCESSYFEGMERHIEKYKRLIEEDNTEELVNFIHTQTKRDIKAIEKDFL